jgi:hypothetical protein
VTIFIAFYAIASVITFGVGCWMLPRMGQVSVKDVAGMALLALGWPVTVPAVGLGVLIGLGIKAMVSR